MRSGPKSAALVAIIFVLSLVLGLGFSGSGGGGGASNFRTTSVPASGSPTPPPKVIVLARSVDPSYLYETRTLSSIPAYLFVPLRGVHVLLTSINREAVSFRQHVPGVILTTNSSGVAVGFMAPGNYSCVVSGSNFRLNTTVSFRFNSTNTINFTLLPSITNVTSLHVISPDTILEVEPQVRISALLASQSAPSLGFAELVGSTSFGTPGLGMNEIAEGMTLNATVVGWYPGAQGTWAVLTPAASSPGHFPSYPTMSVVLFQFKPIIEVSSTAG